MRPPESALVPSLRGRRGQGISGQAAHCDMTAPSPVLRQPTRPVSCSCTTKTVLRQCATGLCAACWRRWPSPRPSTCTTPWVHACSTPSPNCPSTTPRTPRRQFSRRTCRRWRYGGRRAPRWWTWARAIAKRGGLLIGVDLVKPAAVLEPAYDDALGVTAAFNRHLPLHMNRLTGADFRLADWRHVTLFNTAASRIGMQPEAVATVTVRWTRCWSSRPWPRRPPARTTAGWAVCRTRPCAGASSAAMCWCTPAAWKGGAHVITEAVTSGTPVLASRVAGNVGMLGEDYAGYFPQGDAMALVDLLRRCAAQADGAGAGTPSAYLRQLTAQCARRAALFAPACEQRSLHQLIQDILDRP